MIAKLVQITPITMVYGTQITIVTGANLNQLITGGPHIVAGCLPGSSLQMIGGRDAFCGEAGRATNFGSGAGSAGSAGHGRFSRTFMPSNRVKPLYPLFFFCSVA